MLKLIILLLVTLTNAGERKFCSQNLALEKTAINQVFIDNGRCDSASYKQQHTDYTEHTCLNPINVNWLYSNRSEPEGDVNKSISVNMLSYDNNVNTVCMSHTTETCDLLEYTWYNNNIRSMSDITSIYNCNVLEINNNDNVNPNSTKTAGYLDEPTLLQLSANISGYCLLCTILIFAFYVVWKYLYSSQRDVDIELEYGESLSPPLDWRQEDNIIAPIPTQQSDNNGQFQYPPWDEYAFIDQIEGRQDIEINPEQDAVNINLMPQQHNGIHQDDGHFEYPPWE